VRAHLQNFRRLRRIVGYLSQTNNFHEVNVFRSYLKEKHLEGENFPLEQLDDILSNFYFEKRKCCEGVYNTSSFQVILHGLNRFLPNVDIVNDAKNFPKSTEFQSHVG